MIGLTALPAAADAVAEVTALLCDRTIHFADQIEFTSYDGRASLWYAGMDEMIVGTWEVVETPDGRIDVCYKYQPGSFGFADDGLYCHDYARWRETIQAGGVRDGDRFGLETGRIPFRLPAFPALPPAGFDADYPDQPRHAVCDASAPVS
ncbi:MAG: hypothetical protein AAGA70_08860 [Pseudomonadota bacterium]